MATGRPDVRSIGAQWQTIDLLQSFGRQQAPLSAERKSSRLAGLGLPGTVELLCIRSFKAFTLRVPLEGIVCYFHTFENNLGIENKFIK